MSRRSKSTKGAPTTAGAPIAAERVIPLYRIGRWQGGFAVWRNDGMLNSWHTERDAAEAALAAIIENSP